VRHHFDSAFSIAAGAVLAVLVVLGAACSGGKAGGCTGAERCACYGNGTCNTGFVCLSNLCVSPGGSDAAADGDGEAGSGGAAGADAGTGGAGGAGGTTLSPPSCAGLAPTCGPDRDADCCASAVVPGGTFNRGNDANAPATVSPFRLDTYVATVGRFRQFVGAYAAGWRPTAGQGANPHNAQDPGWTSAWDTNLPSDLPAQLACTDYQTWTAAPGANENKPIVCESWYEAFAFCIWDGGRLPTDAEYNFAAAGGTEERTYPWSNPPGDTTIDGTYASYDCMGDGSAAGACAVTDLLIVGSKPKGNGRWGHADLAGNVLQWMRDWSGALVSPCNDCVQLATTDSWRLLRGGSFQYNASYQTAAFRFALYFNYVRTGDLGVRCARVP
jgi:sulfatase modifying factor 1